MKIEEWYLQHKDVIKRIQREEKIYKKEGKTCENCSFCIDGICLSFGDCIRGNLDGTKDYWRQK